MLLSSSDFWSWSKGEGPARTLSQDLQAWYCYLQLQVLKAYSVGAARYEAFCPPEVYQFYPAAQGEQHLDDVYCFEVLFKTV